MALKKFKRFEPKMCIVWRDGAVKAQVKGVVV